MSKRVARVRRATRRSGRFSLNKASMFVMFLGLPLVLFAVFLLWPYLQSFYVAMTNWGGLTREMEFIGFKNFTDKMWSDPVLLKALRNSVVLAAVVPTLVLGVAFLLSWLVTAGGPSIGPIRGMRGGGLHRAIAYFAAMIPVVIVGMIWSQAYDPRRGVLNGLLQAVGLDGFKDFPWLGKVTTALPSAVVVMIWAGVGFYVVLFVSAIQSLPAETFEAARIDGAGRFRMAVSVMLPQMMGILRTGYVYMGMGAIDSFGVMQALFAKASSPDNTATTLTQYLYITAFTKGQFGYATAQGLLLAVVTLAYAGLVFGVFRLITGREEKGLTAS